MKAISAAFAVLVLITLITAGAIAFVYLYVVPQLESSLTAEKLRRLERLDQRRQLRPSLLWRRVFR